MGFLEDALKAKEQAMRDAKIPGEGDDLIPVPDGTYQGLVERFEPFESKRTGWWLKSQFKIVFDPEYDGVICSTLHSLEDEERLPWLKKHLKTLGLDLDEIPFSDLEKHLLELLDVPVEFVVKTTVKGEKTFRNLYVNKRVGDPLGRESSDIPTDIAVAAERGSVPAGDEDLPF